MIANIFKWILLFFVFFIGNAQAKVNLDGNWKVIDFRIPGIGIGTEEAKINLGRIGVIKSDVLKIKLSDMQYECEFNKSLISFKNKIKAEDCDEFDYPSRNSIRAEEFNFTSYVYYCGAKSTNNHFAFEHVIFDSKLENMILDLDGAIYLLHRQSK
jgi:hypothetical protein